ncbi:MAG: hypothetical protein H6818_04555 [Phycisphaerales bacterium]|nr:hypothetical protein [Phycisphaerales bacterium]
MPATEGPTHPYIGASPGCWRIYGDVLGREYGEYGYPECHRLTVDAYAVQHPGVASRRSIQSVGVHLISLYYVLERGVTSDEATRRIGLAVRAGPPSIWLQPPTDPGRLTICDVANAADADAHARIVRAWAESVWEAWRDHHAIIRTWARDAAS